MDCRKILTFSIFITFLVTKTIVGYGQSKLNPEFDNLLYHVEKDSSLVELSKERVSKYKSKNGIGTLKMLIVVEGSMSKTQIKNGSRLSFVVSFSKSNISNIRNYILHKADVTRNKRQSTYLGVSGRKSMGDENIVSYKTKNLNENLLLIILENPVPGEYYFIDLNSPVSNGGNYVLYSFGIIE